MLKFRHILGIIIFCLGIMGGDSENLLIPIIMIIIGVILCKDINSIIDDEEYVKWK